MKEIKKQLELLKRMAHNIGMSERKHEALKKLTTMLEGLTESEKEFVGSELLKITDESLDFLDQTIKAFKSRENAPIIKVGDNSYDMKEWCTISQYAKLFNYKSTMPITNQIRRKVIPSERIVNISELGIKLIRLV